LLIAATAVAVMLAVAWRRNHLLAALLTVSGFCAAFVTLWVAAPLTPRDVTPLLSIDSNALFYIGLILAASVAAVFLCYGYFKRYEEDRPEELYLLIAIATLGSAVLVSASHLASFFLGLEILSVALYGLISYERKTKASVEAGLKYLTLAAASASFLLFGIAVVYFELGTMNFPAISTAIASRGFNSAALVPAAVLIVVGIGFKLGLRPVLASVFTIMLLSLASIPLTAGFLGEFYLVASGASASLWTLVIILVITSAIGLFYYLRIIVVLYSRRPESVARALMSSGPAPYSFTWTLAVLTAAVIVIGCYPGPVLQLIQTMIAGSG